MKITQVLSPLGSQHLVNLWSGGSFHLFFYIIEIVCF